MIPDAFAITVIYKMEVSMEGETIAKTNCDVEVSFSTGES